MSDPQTTPIITDGPNIVCMMCGKVCNHFSGLCADHRKQIDGPEEVTMTKADMDYINWKAQRKS
jgi:hypothetical protein